MQPQTPWTAPDPVVRQLSTTEGFAKAVGTKDAFKTMGVVALTIGLLLVAYNVFSTLRTIEEYSFLDYSLDDMWLVFKVTTDEYGNIDPMPFVYFWGPIVLLPVAAILFVVSRATRSGRVDSAFAAFTERGFVAKALSLPFVFAVGKQRFTPQVIVPAHLATPEVGRWFADVQQSASSMDKAASKQLAKAMSSRLSAVDKAVPAAELLPGAPPFALLVGTPQAVGGETVRVVVPGPGGVEVFGVNLKKIDAPAFSTYQG